MNLSNGLIDCEVKKNYLLVLIRELLIFVSSTFPLPSHSTTSRSLATAPPAIHVKNQAATGCIAPCPPVSTGSPCSVLCLCKAIVRVKILRILNSSLTR